MRIALATAEHLPNLSDDDRLLHSALRSHGMKADALIWDSNADWSAYDVVLVRSIWDYHLKYARFLQWLDALDSAGVRVVNPTSLLRWNADKRYLFDLERAGVRITPTFFVAQQQAAELQDILTGTKWRKAVIKPAVSSTGYETWFVRAPVTREDSRRFQQQASQMDVLVQEFVAGVAEGELSFVFLDGGYSHAVLKRSASDEFRVHIEWGGTVSALTPEPAHISWAQNIVEILATQKWLYARVDAVCSDKGLVLMELELLDPELFFAYHENAIKRVIDALL